MKKELEQYFGCEVKIAEYKNKLPLPIFMTMRDIVMVEIYGVTFAIIDVMKETELSVAAMKKQKAKYEEALQCPVAYEVAYSYHLWELYCRMCIASSLSKRIR